MHFTQRDSIRTDGNVIPVLKLLVGITPKNSFAQELTAALLSENGSRKRRPIRPMFPLKKMKDLLLLRARLQRARA